MALTKEEEDYLKKIKQIAELQDEISDLNTTAVTQLATKRAEITAIQDQLTTDVAAKQAQIDALG